jgi:hypothetical protein
LCAKCEEVAADEDEDDAAEVEVGEEEVEEVEEQQQKNDEKEKEEQHQVQNQQKRVQEVQSVVMEEVVAMEVEREQKLKQKRDFLPCDGTESPPAKRCKPRPLSHCLVQPGKRVELNSGITTIGRAEGSNVMCTDNYISRTHASIKICGKGIVKFTYLGSAKFFCKVNGQWMTKGSRVRLEPGSTIYLAEQERTGKYEFEYQC